MRHRQRTGGDGVSDKMEAVGALGDEVTVVAIIKGNVDMVVTKRKHILHMERQTVFALGDNERLLALVRQRERHPTATIYDIDMNLILTQISFAIQVDDDVEILVLVEILLLGAVDLNLDAIERSVMTVTFGAAPHGRSGTEE